ncbi:hypothetical protein BELL_0103g00180 [Botrytis elliptica]|uniref:Serine peptidase n=1 Tax=Botrytis elliptica TaxID=278938 RepID=A0A4Z1K8A9_9HELO|nr:hypothetical protein EAE99_002635 [Botrytis elliptica]TGO77523.1 hypothetical protein BELL_0103g00180 [Botrytis elliptica]
MKWSIVSAISLLAASAAAEHPFLRKGRLVPPIEAEDEFPVSINAAGVNTTGSAFFTQLLDHDNPSKGTFQQKFWWNSEFWAGPGSPIVFFTPGEIAAANYGAYLTNITVTGRFAQEVKGAVVMVEHRFWGESSPYDNLTTTNLQLLTLKQAIADFVHFAKTVDLPFDSNHSSNAASAPWINSGGSYSGALSAWTESTSPGTFWAYHASSAPVQAIDNYWQYFYPVQDGMPKNCSKDVSLVIDYMDNVLTHGSKSEVTALKTKFGLESVKHNDDFMAVLENGPWLWQSNSFSTGYSGFYQFCDAIENVTAGAAVTPDANGVGLTTALEGYAKWTKSYIPGYCEGFGYAANDTSCFDTHDFNNLMFRDYSVGNAIDRQWNWMLCNEPFGYWQDGAPKNRPTIVSRLIDANYWQRQCALFFPTEGKYTYASAKGATVDRVNGYTKGWDLEKTTRLIWTNGQYDPWRTSGVSSQFRPGGELKSTAKHPVQIIPGGFHCSDLRLKNGQVNAGVQKVIDNEVAQIVAWTAEYYNQNSTRPSYGGGHRRRY